MKELLYIETSPRTTRSASIEVAGAFIDELTRLHPECRVTTLNPWTMELPELSQDMLDAKYAGINGVPLTAAQQTAWDEVRRIASPFHAADHIVLAMPLWNFGVPYKLKHLIDVVSHKDVLFRFDASGLSGMLQTRMATVVCARGWTTRWGKTAPRTRSTFSCPTSRLGCASSACAKCAPSSSKRR